MIIDSSNKVGFLSDMDSGDIEEKILQLMEIKSRKKVGKSEVQSWKNSLPYMERALRGVADIPDDAGISIEYHIPNSAKRVDFIISGMNSERKESAIIVELKQWTTASSVNIP